MERINIGIPTESRNRLRHLARSLGKKEGALARELLVDAVAERERREFFAQVGAAMTPEWLAARVELARALEALRG